MSERDPKAYLEASLAALEISRRIGSRAGMSMALNNLASSAEITGDWDLALDELRAEADTDSADDRVRIQMATTYLLSDRGDDVTQLVASVREYFDSASDEASDFEGFYLGSLALPAGRYREALERLTKGAAEDPFNATAGYSLASVAALLLRDVETAKIALAGLESTGSHGRMVKLDKRRTRAGIDALDDRVDDALAGFRTVLDEYRRLDLPPMVAQTCLVMCVVLDRSLPEVVAAEAEARSIYEALGAQAWLDRLDEALAREATLTEATSA